MSNLADVKNALLNLPLEERIGFFRDWAVNTEKYRVPNYWTSHGDQDTLDEDHLEQGLRDMFIPKRDNKSYMDMDVKLKECISTAMWKSGEYYYISPRNSRSLDDAREYLKSLGIYFKTRSGGRKIKIGDSYIEFFSDNCDFIRGLTRSRVYLASNSQAPKHLSDN